MSKKKIYIYIYGDTGIQDILHTYDAYIYIYICIPCMYISLKKLFNTAKYSHFNKKVFLILNFNILHIGIVKGFIVL